MVEAEGAREQRRKEGESKGGREEGSEVKDTRKTGKEGRRKGEREEMRKGRREEGTGR